MYVLLCDCHVPLALQLNMSGTVQDSNEKHMVPWSEACERDGITSSHLSPYLDEVHTSS